MNIFSTSAVNIGAFLKTASFAGILSLASVLTGCGKFLDAGATPQDIAYHSDKDPSWIYTGPLPSLENVRVVASLKGHTARVTGLLPAGWSTPLPFYAIPEKVGSRTQITVVYPMATGDLNSRNENGSAVENGPGRYNGVSAYPYNEYGAGSAGGSKTEWGGFPFLMYNSGRALAFHGPITHTGSNWQLWRGPVSHGCNRMQGEHVVELAQLMGVNLRSTYSASAVLNLNVVVDVINGYDTVNGKFVDVNYPAEPGVALPPLSQSRVFPTWKSQDFPRFVCEFKSGRALDAAHCDYKPANRLNPSTGTVGTGSGGATESLRDIACPAGYTLTNVGTQGGKYCTDGTNVWGPFTEGMIQKCLSWGGGDAACRSNRWYKQLALDARGTALCPIGAFFDTGTGYCAEGSNAFGPFPAALIAKCEAAGGGSAACNSARWSRNFLASLQR